jgi:hypothetical protein
LALGYIHHLVYTCVQVGTLYSEHARMVNRNKAKGTTWESAIVAYLKSRWWPFADRLTLSGSQDRGDIRLGDGIKVVIEAKNEKSITLAGYIKEVEAEVKNAGADIGAAWIKRVGKTDPAEAYVVMTGETFTKLLKEAGYTNGTS